MKNELVALAVLSLSLCACEGGKRTPTARPSTGGSTDRGEQAIYAHGCGACHSIPGIRGAHGTVAPPLDAFAARTFIAGELPNTPDNLVRWLEDPPRIHPKTAMPALGVDDREARDIAAYLYTLD